MVQSALDGPQRLRVRWSDSWRPEMDAALALMPEQDACPHELFKLLAQNPSPTRKRLALVEDGGEPVALFCLRRKQRHWEPVTQGVCSGAKPLARDGYLFPALAALRTDVRLNDWEAPPPQFREVWNPSWPSSHTMYKAPLTGDYEGHWRKTDYLKAVRRARRRCESFRLVVDGPGAADWIIGSWEQRWRDDPESQTLVAGDMKLMAHFFLKTGQYHTLSILDGEQLIAGQTVFVEDKTLVALCTTFDQAYAWHRVGTYLMDRFFDWGAAQGYEEIDLGGYHEHKGWVAPDTSEAWNFGVCPPHQQAVKAALQAAKRRVMAVRFGISSRLSPAKPVDLGEAAG